MGRRLACRHYHSIRASIEENANDQFFPNRAIVTGRAVRFPSVVFRSELIGGIPMHGQTYGDIIFKLGHSPGDE